MQSVLCGGNSVGLSSERIAGLANVWGANAILPES